MNLSDAKDLYIGSKPVKEVWMNGKLVWHRPDNIGLMLTDGRIIDYTQVMADGKTYELSEVVGVTVQETKASFVIHPKYGNNGETCYFSSGNKRVPSLFFTGLEYSAHDYYNGYEDTQIIIDEFGTYNSDWAAPSAKGTMFNNGESGYLMSAGEAVIIYNNRDKINDMLAKINGADTIVDGKGIWTSTGNSIQEDTGYIYQVWYLMENPTPVHRIDGANVQAKKYVRPIARINNN